jgi:hypothetical protein
VFLAGNECFYDERLNLKEDYDMSLQQTNRYRKLLRVNRYYMVVRQSEQAGGCAAQRTIDRERQQFLALQAKWGSKIVRRDHTSILSHNKNRRPRARFEDYNPIIKIPIPGV